MDDRAEQTTVIKDPDAWRKVCLEAYANLSRDTSVTMGQIDAVLLAGAREEAGIDTATAAGAAQYEALLDRVSEATGVDRHDIDAIFCMCARDALSLIVEDDNALSAGMWHLLQSMLQDRIRKAEQNGVDEDDPSSVYRRDLSRRLLWHEMRAREVERPGHERLPRAARGAA